MTYIGNSKKWIKLAKCLKAFQKKLKKKCGELPFIGIHQATKNRSNWTYPHF